MSQNVIDIQNLGKRYRLGETCGTARALSNTIGDGVRRLCGRVRGGRDARPTGDFWALRDVTFHVERGEALGIIGANGAGKSTLLKILSRVTEPTSGRAELNGRVASLLEVGTGFHPELTGRENIKLNGAILGMKRKQIRDRFDEIVDFSGVESFLDTPIKRYSSGMRVRLAFAVAAHLDPEIMVIDEVLAVGDAAFQKKCLGKMNQFTTATGRSILFVSHQMAAVKNLCARSIWLDHGRIAMIGPTAEVLDAYLRVADDDTGQTPLPLGHFRLPGMNPIFQAITLLDAHGQPTHAIPAGGGVSVVIDYRAEHILRNPTFAIGVDSEDGHRLIFFQTKLQHGLIERLPTAGRVRCRIPRLPLAPGQYSLSFGCAADGRELDQLARPLKLRVLPNDVYGTGQLPLPHQGRMLVEADWSLPAAAVASSSPLRRAG